jgi:hypothetical protein
MKSAVFGNGLLFMAFSRAGAVRVRQLGHVPLLVQSKVFLTDLESLPAVPPVRGSRPPHVIVCAASHAMIGNWAASGAKPAVTEANTSTQQRIAKSKYIIFPSALP